MKRLRLLVLCDVVDRVGGTESYLSRVLPALAAEGVDVSIVARRVTLPGAFGIPAREIAWGNDDEAPRPQAALAVAEAIAELRPDVVMTSNVHDHTVIDAARAAPLLVVRVHDHRLFCPQGDRRFPHGGGFCTSAMSVAGCAAAALVRGCAAGVSLKTLRLLRSRKALHDAVLRADHFVVASKFVADLCAQNGVPAARITTIAPPFDGREVRRPAPRPAVDRVLFAGRLVRDKGLRSLIDAVAAIPEPSRPHLAVAGAPTRESRPLPAYARKRGVAMTMLGRLEQHALKAEIDASTLLAVPSLWPEPFGLSGIEAQARGRPVVAFDVGGIPEWIGDPGMLAPRGDVAALARAIERVLDRRTWPLFAESALRQSVRFRLDAHVAPLVRLLRSREDAGRALRAEAGALERGVPALSDAR
jgi:glycosyltransferase involved in cell wall biosynthesis